MGIALLIIAALAVFWFVYSTKTQRALDVDRIRMGASPRSARGHSSSPDTTLEDLPKFGLDKGAGAAPQDIVDLVQNATGPDHDRAALSETVAQFFANAPAPDLAGFEAQLVLAKPDPDARRAVARARSKGLERRVENRLPEILQALQALLNSPDTDPSALGEALRRFSRRIGANTLYAVQDAVDGDPDLVANLAFRIALADDYYSRDHDIDYIRAGLRSEDPQIQAAAAALFRGTMNIDYERSSMRHIAYRPIEDVLEEVMNRQPPAPPVIQRLHADMRRLIEDHRARR